MFPNRYKACRKGLEPSKKSMDFYYSGCLKTQKISFYLPVEVVLISFVVFIGEGGLRLAGNIDLPMERERNFE